MKKIKISEAQADMLKKMGMPKVLKVTQEQYNRILEAESAMSKEMVKQAKPIDRPQMRRDLKNANPMRVNEMYESFLNELYGLSESEERTYSKLHKLMEASGLISEGRIIKEKFGGDKKRVREVISAGLSEMECGNSVYRAMEAIEEALELGDITPSYFAKQLEPKAKSGKSDSERQEAIKALRDKELERRKEAGEMNEDKEGGIVGTQIFNYEPFSQLPQTRQEVDWANRPNINIPSISDGDAQTGVFCKDDVMEFINKFNKSYGEEPIFELNPGGVWFDRVRVTNPAFTKWRDEYVKGKAATLKSWGTTNEEEIDEETGAGASADGGSSGPYTGDAGLGVQRKHTFNADEIQTEETGTIQVGGESGTFAYDHPGAIGGKVDGEDDIDMLAGNKLNKKKVSEDLDKPTRYVAEMDFYLWAKSDEEAKSIAQRMAGEMDSKYDNQPRIQKLFKQPHGTLGATPVNEDAHNTTQWKGGSFVSVKDKCKKFPYCNQGADAIETKKTKDAVISNDHIVQEVAKKSGKSIDEVSTILENFNNSAALKCLEVCKHTNSIIEANPNTIIEVDDEGSRFLVRFKPLGIDEESFYVEQLFDYSEDGKNWRPERRSRTLTEPLWNNKYGHHIQTNDCKLIQAGIENAKHGMATDLNTLRGIKKEIS
jgi:hypothetical protein